MSAADSLLYKATTLHTIPLQKTRMYLNICRSSRLRSMQVHCYPNMAYASLDSFTPTSNKEGIVASYKLQPTMNTTTYCTICPSVFWMQLSYYFSNYFHGRQDQSRKGLTCRQHLLSSNLLSAVISSLRVLLNILPIVIFSILYPVPHSER